MLLLESRNFGSSSIAKLKVSGNCLRKVIVRYRLRIAAASATRKKSNAPNRDHFTTGSFFLVFCKASPLISRSREWTAQ